MMHRVGRYIAYDPHDGVFTWRTAKGRRKVGSPAGTLRKDGYLQIKVNGKMFLAHRIAWFLVHGEQPKELDHIDGDPSNNRIVNLRRASHSDNLANQRDRRATRGTRPSRNGKRYTARIVVDYKDIHIGTFDTEEEACAAYAKAAREHFGEFARCTT
jgi:hypothetical protein